MELKKNTTKSGKTATNTINKRYKQALAQQKAEAAREKKLREEGKVLESERVLGTFPKIILIYEILVIVFSFHFQSEQKKTYSLIEKEYQEMMRDDLYGFKLKEEYIYYPLQNLTLSSDDLAMPTLLAQMKGRDELGRYSVTCPKSEIVGLYNRLKQDEKIKLFKVREGYFLCFPPDRMLELIRPNSLVGLIISTNILPLRMIFN